MRSGSKLKSPVQTGLFFYFKKTGLSVNSAIAGKKCMGKASAGNTSGKSMSSGKAYDSGSTRLAMVITLIGGGLVALRKREGEPATD